MDEQLIADRSRAPPQRPRRQARLARRPRRLLDSLHHPQDPLLRGAERGRPGAARAQRRHHSGGNRHRFPRRSRGARDLEGGRRRRARASACISPRGMCRSLVQRTAPREFTQHARNPARNVVIGGKNTVFAPAYGSPFVRNLDEGRRYARIEDFRNFVKLAYMRRLAAPFGRHDLRAGRSAGQQAAPRHGLQPSANTATSRSWAR